MLRMADAGAFRPVWSQNVLDEALRALERIHRAIAQLAEAGFIQEITGRKRDRVWVAAELLAELDDLDRRIQREMTG